VDSELPLLWTRAGWFLAFVSAVVLPSPTLYFYYKDTRSDTGTRLTGTSTAAESDGFEENPLSKPGQSDVYDVESSELLNVPPTRTKLAKMQREGKNMRSQVQKMQAENQNLQTQLLQLQTEGTAKDNKIVSLEAITTAKDESTKVQALQAQIAALQAQSAQGPQPGDAQLQLSALSDASPGTNVPLQQAAAKTVAIKEFAADEGLSEETRESAKQALDDMATAQIMLSTMQSKNETAAAQVMLNKKALRDTFTSATSLGTSEGIREEMSTYLESLRLLHYADAVIRVAGMCVD
jgi:hypothetical protein